MKFSLLQVRLTCRVATTSARALNLRTSSSSCSAAEKAAATSIGGLDATNEPDEVDTREKAWQDNAVSELDDGCPPKGRECRCASTAYVANYRVTA